MGKFTVYHVLESSYIDGKLKFTVYHILLCYKYTKNHCDRLVGLKIS